VNVAPTSREDPGHARREKGETQKMMNYFKVSRVGEDLLHDGDALPRVPGVAGRRWKSKDGDFSQQDPRHFDSWLYFFEDDDEAGCRKAHAQAERKAADLFDRLNGKGTSGVRMSVYSKVLWFDLPVIGVSPRQDRVEEPAAAQ
jgi:hypothetical protein